MKKALLIAWCALFLAVCAVPALGLIPGVSWANKENRALSAPPALWDGGGLNERFGEAFDAYFSDHFALRSQMVTANALLRAALLRDSANEKVVLGRDGWLFYADTMDDYLGLNRLPDADIARLARTLALMKEACAQKGCRFLVALAPNKNTLYPRYMPQRLAPTWQPGNLDRLQAALAASAVPYADLKAALGASADILYHKTDTHWTNRGAYIAREAILTALDASRPPAPEPPFTAQKNWSGDLAVMLYPALNAREDQYYYNWDPGYGYAGTPPRAMDELRIETQGGQGEHRLLMFRDSFGNALLPLIAGEFSAALFTRAVPYDLSLIDGINADTVVLQIVERNIPDILNKAPVSDAPAREAVAGPVAAAEGVISCTLGRDGQLLIQGWLAADPAEPVFVELTAPNGETLCYEAYPILAEDQRDALAMAEGALGFTARVAGLTAGEYAVRAVGGLDGGAVATACEFLG